MTDLKFAATPLHGRFVPRWDADPFVVRIATDPTASDPERSALVLSDDSLIEPNFRAYLTRGGASEVQSNETTLPLPSELNYLRAGDIVRINPRRGEIWVMYRRETNSNSILLTERCNSWCVMCSQPPKISQDDALLTAWMDAIPLMDKETPELGFTGGEPTLLGSRFLDLVRTCKEELPNTGLHVLSNGRLCNYLSFVQQLRAVVPDNFMIGIPLYSDLAWQHDFVVQSKSAFDQTIRGMLNLARCKVPVEIRVVIHRHTVNRLPMLAEFICRNLPFVAQVALMGMEPIGFARTNLAELWIDPADYGTQLRDAVQILDSHQINVSVYNHQLCTLPEDIWRFACQSISDWKNIYLPVCSECEVRDRCGGFFHSAVEAHSRAIHPIRLHSIMSSP